MEKTEPRPIAALSMNTNSRGGLTPPIFFNSLCTLEAASAPYVEEFVSCIFLTLSSSNGE